MSSIAKPIYLDYCATTPVDPRVLDSMWPWFSEKFGNASSSSHAFGWDAAEAVDAAREQVADLVGVQPREIVFTSGATESINLGLFGVARALQHKGNHIVTCVTEHQAMLETCRELENSGFPVSYLPVDANGCIDLQELEATITGETILVSLMAANNETGVRHPLEAISSITHAKGALLMSDVTQAAGKVPLNLNRAGVDLAAFSAHKIYGPKGVGALYVRKNSSFKLPPRQYGGGQERGLRAGTLNVPGIVGMGMACEIAAREMSAESKRLETMRNRLESALSSPGGEVTINGAGAERLPQVSSLSFRQVDGSRLLRALHGLAVSQGSACHSAVMEPSPVLRAMGLNDELALASLRVSLGRFTTDLEIESAVGIIKKAVTQLRYSHEPGI